MRNAPLDTLVVIETPEGVQLRLAAASIPVRALAFVYDQVILLVASMVFGLLFSTFATVGQGLWLLFAFFSQWLYPVLFEALWQGQTPGKRGAGIRVVHSDGSPVALPAAMLRGLLRIVDILFGAALAFVCMSSTQGFRRLGDLVAGTLVVYAERPATLPSFPATVQRPLPRLLAPDEQRLLVAFAERAPQWSAARRIELAEIAEPLHGERGEAAVDALVGMAAGVAGRG